MLAAVDQRAGWHGRAPLGLGSSSARRSSASGLGGQRAAARVELQQHRLRGLAGEPELAAVGVEAMTFARDEHPALGPFELGWLGEPDVGQQLGDTLAAGPRAHVARERLRADERRPRRPLLPARRHEHRKIAEPGLARPLDETQRGARVGRDERCGPPGQRGGHRPLVTGVDLEQRQRQPLAFLGERSRRRRETLALGERVLQRGQPLAGESGLFLQSLALGVRA